MIRAILKKGTLLVASRHLETPLFCESVMLICEMTHDGTFALIINKPLEPDIIEQISIVDEIHNPHVGARISGPYAPESVMLLHRGTVCGPDMITVMHDVQLGGTPDFCKQTLESSKGPQALVCLGHYMWSPGQLEEEILEGLWSPVSGCSDDIFDSDPEQLWRQLFVRAHGTSALSSGIPDDLSLN